MRNDDVAIVLRAAAFAAERHRHQRRKDAERTPYVNHPLALALLLVECGVRDPDVLAAGLLHDTIEDTDTRREELDAEFGARVASIVGEVTDDKTLQKSERKRRQIEHAARKSPEARLVKLADKTCNLRDIGSRPPADWSAERRREYFDWAKRVVDALGDVGCPPLKAAFDAAYARRAAIA